MTKEKAPTNGHKPAFTLNLDDLTDSGGRLTYAGKAYAYKPWGAFGLLERKRIGKQWGRVLDIEGQDEISVDEEGEHNALLCQLLMTISDIPDDVVSVMHIDLVAEGCLAFFVYRASNMTKKTAKISEAMNLTGPASSPASIAAGPEETP